MKFNNNVKNEVKQYHRLTNLYFNDYLYVENDNLRQDINLVLKNPTYQFNKNSYFNVSHHDHGKIKDQASAQQKMEI